MDAGGELLCSGAQAATPPRLVQASLSYMATRRGGRGRAASHGRGE